MFWNPSLSIKLAGTDADIGKELRRVCTHRKWHFISLLSLKLFHTLIYLLGGNGCLPIRQAWQKRSQAVCGQKGGVQIIAPLVSRQRVCKHLWIAKSSQTHAKICTDVSICVSAEVCFWPRMSKLAAALAAQSCCGGGRQARLPPAQTLSLTESCVPAFLMRGKHRQERAAVVQPLDRLTFPSLQPLSLQQAVPQTGLFRIAARSK